MKNRWFIGILILIVCLLAASLVAGAAERVELVHWNVPLGEMKVKTDQMLAEEFMQLHPEVKVVTETVPWGQVELKVRVGLAAGMPPNIQRDYFGRLAAWINLGATTSLNDTFSEADLDAFYPDLIEAFTFDGELSGMPTVFTVNSYHVNKGILDKAGAVFPEGEWTVADYEEIARKVKAIGIWPDAFFAGSEQGDNWTLVVFEFFGAEIWKNGDYTETALNSPAGVQALEWMISMVEKGLIPPGVAGRKAGEFAAMQRTGKIAMGAGAMRNSTLVYRQKMLESGQVEELQDIRLTEIPRLEGLSSPGYPFSTAGVVVFEHDDAEEVYWAKQWVKFLTSEENIEWNGVSNSQFMSRKSVNPWVGRETFDRALELIEKNGMYDVGMKSRFYNECRHLLYPELQAAFLGVKTAQEALDDFAKAVEVLWE